MILFPAIDILEGRAVRLLYGDRDKVTDYGDPVDRAKEWIDCGAEFLHVVDLSGAFEGDSRINPVLEKIAALGVPVQSGGGLRSYAAVKARLNTGAARVVLGTAAYANPELFRRLLLEYGDRIVAGIDARGGLLSVKGWTETSSLSAVDFGRKVADMGGAYCVFTDISRDGALGGANLAESVRMQRETGLNVVASGGVSSHEDLRKLKEAGLYGAILGRSIYTGAVSLARAVRECKEG